MSVIPNEPCYLGIDLGTSATKAVVLTADGTVLARCRVTHPTARTAQPGRADPNAWRDSIAAACRQLGEIAQHVQAVGIDTHCPCALLLDDDGKPLTRGLSWDHPGMAAPTAELIELTTAAHRRLIGNRLAPATAMAAAYRLFCELEPDAVSRATTFGLVGTWLGQWLTGERAIDPTQASYTGAMATTEGGGRWLTDLLEAFDVPVGLLPPVRSSLDVLGPLLPSAARELGLPAGVPVLVGSADTPAASYALDVKPGGRPLFIMGTTHVISNCLDAPDLRSQALQRADVRPGQWLINGVINGGDALALGAKMLGYGLGDVAVAGMIGIAGRAQATGHDRCAGVHPARPRRTWTAVVRRTPHRTARPAHRHLVTRGRPRGGRGRVVRRPDDHRIVHQQGPTHAVRLRRVRRRPRTTANAGRRPGPGNPGHRREPPARHRRRRNVRGSAARQTDPAATGPIGEATTGLAGRHGAALAAVPAGVDRGHRDGTPGHPGRARGDDCECCSSGWMYL